MNTSINYGLGKYKGVWQPLTQYQQHDVVHDGTSLWVAKSTFTSSATFNDVDWECAYCGGEAYPHLGGPEQGFDLSLGVGSKLHSIVGGDDSIIENPTGSDILDDAVWATVSHLDDDTQLRYFEYKILNGGVRLMCGYGINSPNEWVGNTGTESLSYDVGNGLTYRNGVLFRIFNTLTTNDVVRVWTRGQRVWFGTYSISNGYTMLSGDPYINYKPTAIIDDVGNLRPMVTCYSPSSSVKLNTIGNFEHPPLPNAKPWDI